MREPRDPGTRHRYLGLDLGGAKNARTALAVLEHYPKEGKVFLLDIFDRIAAHDEQTGDEALLATIAEVRDGAACLGVNVPLTLPPCLSCTRLTCPLPARCTVPAVRWMRETTRRAPKKARKDFTPYTQRPVELWARYSLMAEIQEAARFEIDEALGGNKAPLTVRMHHLKRQLQMPLVEAWPKLTVARLAERIGVSRRTLQAYRRLEEGAAARAEILELLAEKEDVFIYERDARKLATGLSAFDAFVCAYTALLSDSGRCAKIPAGFPAASGWIQIPR